MCDLKVIVGGGGGGGVSAVQRGGGGQQVCVDGRVIGRVSECVEGGVCVWGLGGGGDLFVGV